MSFHDDVTGMLPQMIEAAESMMTDTVLIRRLKWEKINRDTGLPERAYAIVYEGKGKIQSQGGQQTETSASKGAVSMGGKMPSWYLLIHIPLSATGVQTGDELLVVKSRQDNLVGRRLRLLNWQSEKSFATAQRWWVQEIPRNEVTADASD